MSWVLEFNCEESKSKSPGYLTRTEKGHTFMWALTFQVNAATDLLWARRVSRIHCNISRLAFVLKTNWITLCLSRDGRVQWWRQGMRLSWAKQWKQQIPKVRPRTLQNLSAALCRVSSQKGMGDGSWMLGYEKECTWGYLLWLVKRKCGINMNESYLWWISLWKFARTAKQPTMFGIDQTLIDFWQNQDCGLWRRSGGSIHGSHRDSIGKSQTTHWYCQPKSDEWKGSDDSVHHFATSQNKYSGLY